jgi:uncharacterized protein YfaA (DUF2138 family)
MRISARSPEQQRAQRRALLADYLDLRFMRLRGQRIATLLGHGYRRTPPCMMAIRFERRRLGWARLAFVAPTREPLAGQAP